MLWEIKSRLAIIEQQLGLIQQTAQDPHRITPPRIPWGDWYVETVNDSMSKLMINEGAKVADVYHRQDFPQLPTALALTPKLYQCLRELLILFTEPSKALGTPWACMFYNGNPVAPDMVTAYLQGLALIASLDPTPLGNGPTPTTVPLDETRIGLGPVKLEERKKKDPGLRIWQYPDGRYTLSLEAEPLDTETGLLLQYIGDVTVKAKGDDDISKCF